MHTFEELGVRPEIVAALAADGITTAFPIQELTLPLALSGLDIIGQAKTGTGKTLGFTIPMLERILAPGEGDLGPAAGKPQALVVVPTRELCAQVTGDVELASKGRPVRVLAVYGGRAYEPQVDTLRKGVDIVVGTPGRLLDLAEQGHLDLSFVKILVLDEADEMLDLGFLPDVERILGRVSPERQTMLFSATMRGQVINLARQYMNRPTHIRATDPEDTGATVAAVEQHVFRAHALDKVEMLARILQAHDRGLTIVFCRTKRTAAKVADDLTERGFAAGAVHGDLGQGAREQALRAFRNGKVDVLVATDVAARGIDVDNVTHVINYQCPEDEKIYLHRIGRTARAGASGVAVTFVDWDDLPRWSVVNAALDLPFADPPETYSNSEHLYVQLRIPAAATGVLPRGQRVRAGLEAEVVEDLGETGKARSRRPAARDAGPSAPAAGPAREEAERPARARRPRDRKRTRGGLRPSDAATGSEADDAAAGAPAPSTLGEADAGEGAAPRRRRRGGRGRGRSSEVVAADAGDSSPDA
jgi:superfamily II DNA/RNA helicase